MIKKLDFLKTYLSPFKPIKIKLYIGKVSLSVPYFLPRKLVKGKVSGTKVFVPKKIGFDFIGLGYKTKWSYDDYRFEWSPIWSFVFFKWQIALIFTSINSSYWECWLSYFLLTNKKNSIKERIKEAKEKFPCVWILSTGEHVCYWDIVLKNKYV